MHNHYVPLIICSQKNAKSKGNRKHKLSSYSTGNLKSKKPCGQSSIKAFLNKSSPEKKGKLNIKISENCAVMRSFSSSSILSPKLLFSPEKSRNVEKSLLNVDLGVPTLCSGKSIVKDSESNSEKISSSLAFPKISVFQATFQLIN